MTRRRRFAVLFPVVLFLVLRALSHANPAPLPWTSGVFDGAGLDDILQTIRVKYTASAGLGHVVRSSPAVPSGRVSVAEPPTLGGATLATTHSRAPPRS